MTLTQWRRFDVQANYALVLSLVSLPPLLAAGGLALRNYQHTLAQIVYGSKSLFLPAFAGCVLISLVPGALAFVLGLNSAGQRRNDRSARSWMGFFLGGAVITANLILIIAFVLLRFQKPM